MLDKAPIQPDKPERMMVPRKSKVDLALVWKLRVVNRLSFKEIAQTMGCSKSTVHAALERLHKMLPDPDLAAAYEGVEAQLLTAGKAKLLASLLDDDAILKSSLNNRAYAFTQLHTAHRLNSGQTTQNLGLLGKLVVQSANELFKEEKKAIPEPPPEEKEVTSCR